MDQMTRDVLDLLRQQRDELQTFTEQSDHGDAWWEGAYEHLSRVCDAAHLLAEEDTPDPYRLFVDAIAEYRTSDELPEDDEPGDPVESVLDDLIARARQIMAGDD